MRHTIHWAIVAIAAAAPTAHAQVFKCKDAHGRVMYSDTGCSSMQQGHKIEREKTMEEKYQERARAYQAQQDKQARLLREQEREAQEREDRAMRAASAPPVLAAPRHKGYAERLAERNGSVQSTQRGGASSDSGNRGMTRMEREAALARASTTQARDAALQEATTVLPGAQGLTASQLDAVRRVNAAKAGQPLPPSALPPQEEFSAAPMPHPSISPTPSSQTALTCKGGWCNDGQGVVYSRSSDGRFLNGPGGKTCSISANGKMANCH